MSVLKTLASALLKQKTNLLEANRKDLAVMEESNPLYDRLLLTEKRLQDISNHLLAINTLPSPLDKVLEKRTLPNGLELTKVTVPLGTVGVIYEARPNVTFDVFALCFKSGNRCVLKGGSDAKHSNKAIVSLIHDVLEECGVSKEMIRLLPSDRDAVIPLLEGKEDVDVIIPRGSHKLIKFVRENSRVPVIETGAGIVHTYVDKCFDPTIATNVILNAKTRRVSVCNALDTLVVHRDVVPSLTALLEPLIQHNVHIYADKIAHHALDYPSHLLHLATEEHFGTEFLDYKMSIKTVSSLEEALSHISNHSSKHSEAIISTDPTAIEQFLNKVDAAVVYANCSTAFTDGGEFGLGAEIGISTQKLHARGPMGLQELTSYKWVVIGSGQIRS